MFKKFSFLPLSVVIFVLSCGGSGQPAKTVKASELQSAVYKAFQTGGLSAGVTAVTSTIAVGDTFVDDSTPPVCGTFTVSDIDIESNDTWLLGDGKTGSNSYCKPSMLDPVSKLGFLLYLSK
jgi:hypothetical protein